MTDLGNVFQQYQGSLFVATPTDPTNSVITDNFAQFCTYSDSSSISNGLYSAGTDTFIHQIIPLHGLFIMLIQRIQHLQMVINLWLTI